MSINEVFWLLVMFEIKHFLCDFSLQVSYIQKKFRSGRGWIAYLLSHSLMHAVATACIVLLILKKPFSDTWGLIAIELIIHFVLDCIKASPNILGKWKPEDKYFWWVLGQDQMFRHFTYYTMIWWIAE
jgi:hypothetical protein